MITYHYSMYYDPVPLTFILRSSVSDFFVILYHPSIKHTGQCLRRIASGNIGLPLDTT